ncbi:MAG: MFS transporter [Syntrophomonadaceae bacterium]|jgi:MFS family permease
MLGDKDGNDGNTRILMQISKIWTKNFTLLCFANLAIFMSIQVLLPTLPVYLSLIGGSQQDVGFAMGAFTICAMVVRPIAGWLVDTYGRKRVITLGMFLLFAVSGLYRLSTLPIMIIAARGLHGLAFGVVGTAVSTLVVDILPKTRLTEGMGYFGLTTSLSMSIAPIIGFWLADNMGYPALFLWIVAMSLVALILSLPVKEVSFTRNTSEGYFAHIWANLLERSSIPASSVMFLIAVVYGSVLSFIALYALESGIDNIGVFFTVMAVSTLISRPLSGRWADRGGTSQVILIGQGGVFIATLIIALSHSIEELMIAGAMLGFGIGFCVPTLQALSVRYAPAYRRGAATGTFFIAFDLGIGLGTIVWGYVVAFTSFQIMYFTSLIPVILAGALFNGLKTRGYFSPREELPAKI